MLRIVGFEGEIQEWYDYGGHPYHFKIKITSYKGLDEGILRRLNGLIREYKNARSFLEDIAFSSAVKGDVPKIGTTYQAIGKIELLPNFENNLIISSRVKSAATYHSLGRVDLLPS